MVTLTPQPALSLQHTEVELYSGRRREEDHRELRCSSQVKTEGVGVHKSLFLLSAKLKVTEYNRNLSATNKWRYSLIVMAKNLLTREQIQRNNVCIVAQ